MREEPTCKNCGHVVQVINYALGPKWMHVAVGASFPTVQRGTAWEYCRTTVAEVKE